MIRDKLDAGALPHDHPARLRAGKGSGNPCTACGEPIAISEPEFEPQYTDARPVLRFHGKCYDIWDAERDPQVS
jgi:hypothetical protein